MLVFAIIGIAFHRLRYSLAALAVGLVLGGDLETNVFQTNQIFGWHFYNRPLTDILFALTILALVGQAVRLRRRRADHRASPAGSSPAGSSPAGSSPADSSPAGSSPASAGHPGEPAGTGPGPGAGHPVLEVAVAAAILVVSLIYVVVGLGYGPGERLLPVLVGSVAGIAAGIHTVRSIVVLVRLRQRAGTGSQAPAPAPAPAPAGGPAAADGGVSARRPVLAAAADVRARTAGLVRPVRLLRGGGRAGPGAAAGDPPGRRLAPGTASPEPAAGGRPDRPSYWREAAAFGWVLAMVAGAYLLGFLVAVPLIVFLYGLLASGCATRRSRLAFAVVSSIVMAGVTYGMFSVLHLSYPGMLNL
jgi:hypothetical protein